MHLGWDQDRSLGHMRPRCFSCKSSCYYRRQEQPGPCVHGIPFIRGLCGVELHCIAETWEEGSYELLQGELENAYPAAQVPGLESCSAFSWLADLGRVLYFLTLQSLQLENGTNSNA